MKTFLHEKRNVSIHSGQNCDHTESKNFLALRTPHTQDSTTTFDYACKRNVSVCILYSKICHVRPFQRNLSLSPSDHHPPKHPPTGKHPRWPHIRKLRCSAILLRTTSLECIHMKHISTHARTLAQFRVCSCVCAHWKTERLFKGRVESIERSSFLQVFPGELRVPLTAAVRTSRHFVHQPIYQYQWISGERVYIIFIIQHWRLGITGKYGIAIFPGPNFPYRNLRR